MPLSLEQIKARTNSGRNLYDDDHTPAAFISLRADYVSVLPEHSTVEHLADLELFDNPLQLKSPGQFRKTAISVGRTSGGDPYRVLGINVSSSQDNVTRVTGQAQAAQQLTTSREGDLFIDGAGATWAVGEDGTLIAMAGGGGGGTTTVESTTTALVTALRADLISGAQTRSEGSIIVDTVAGVTYAVDNGLLPGDPLVELSSTSPATLPEAVLIVADTAARLAIVAPELRDGLHVYQQSDDTQWDYDGAAWSQDVDAVATNPPGRVIVANAAARAALVAPILTEGVRVFEQDTNQLYEYSQGGNWFAVPAQHLRIALPNLAARGAVIAPTLKEGLVAYIADTNDSYIFEDGAWSLIVAPNAIPNRQVVADDTARLALVAPLLFDGLEAYVLATDATWIYENGAWALQSSGQDRFYVLNGATQAVTDQSLVIAEAGVFLTVPAGVESFELIESGNDAWTSVLDTPDLTFPVGDTIAAGTTITLAADGGGPLNVYRIPATGVWHIAQNVGSTTAAGGDEIGQGSVLPAVTSGFEMFIVDGSGATPAGTYSLIGGAWVQA